MGGSMGSGRNRDIIRTGFFVIAADLLLSAAKFAVGVMANSVSIMADAVNNAGDALSALITIIGVRLSEKKPDRRHPFGYGRVEYLSSLAIGIVILYAGADMFQGAVIRILHPQQSTYSAVTLAVVSLSMVFRIFIGRHTRKKGTALSSDALIALGSDALNDSFASAATLAAAIVSLTTGRSIEAWVGAAISLLVIWSGIGTLRESCGTILGESTDLELARAIRRSIRSFPEVEGVYDIEIHSYGKNNLMGSAHIEVSDRFTVAWIDNLQRAVTRRVREETGVDLLGLSIYAINSRSEETIRARETVRGIVMSTEGARQMHGFYIDLIDKTMNFDVVADYGQGSMDSLHDEILRRVLESYPEYDVRITVEHDFTD